MAYLKGSITNYMVIAFLCFGAVSCAANYESTTAGTNNSKFTFTMGVPGYPNKRVSGYIFASGALIGVVRSNTMTDSKGNLTVTAQAVDSNNCPTGGSINHSGSSLSIHFRLDGEGNNSIINPTACLSSAGFLDAANLGYTYNYTSYWPMNISYMTITSKVTYTLSATGVTNLARKTRCSVVDGTIANPGYFTSSNMGYFEGDVNYNGAGSPTGGPIISEFKIPYGTTNTYKYTCWIDANDSKTYNAGDKISTSTDPSTMSVWTTVPP
jgi:hypothetical protein